MILKKNLKKRLHVSSKFTKIKAINLNFLANLKFKALFRDYYKCQR